VSADSAATGSFRLQLALRGFSSRSFLVDNDRNGFFGATLGFSWTLLDILETNAAVHNHANFNDFEEPELFQVLGDTIVGVKGWYHVMPWLALAG
jgi:OmpA-OmpF porin, OOP family